jgi:hypothetical protein
MRVTVGLAAMCAMAFVLPAWAHHSHGNYEPVPKDIEGVVTEVVFAIPHSFLYLQIKDANGQPQLWSVEATSRTGLEKIGVTREYVKVGDTVKARCHPLRDGTTGCLLGFLKARDGSVKDWDGGNAPAPPDF